MTSRIVRFGATWLVLTLNVVGGGGARASEIQLNGNYAFTTDAQGRLAVYNVSSGTNAVWLATYPEVDQINGLFLHGRHISLATVDGLVILDVSIPTAPQLVRRYDSERTFRDVVVTGGLSYLADDDWQVSILDVVEPKQPHPVTAIFPTDKPVSLYWANDVLYVASGLGLEIFDVSDPADFEPWGIYQTPSSARRVKVVGQQAYVLSGNGRLNIISVQNPELPVLLGSYQSPGWVSDLDVAGNFVALVTTNGALTVLNVANVSAPVVHVSSSVPGGGAAVRLLGQRAYVQTRTGNLLIYQIPGLAPAGPRVVWAVEPVTAVIGSNAVLSVVAEGSAPLGVQWSKDGVPLVDGGQVSGAQSPYLHLSGVGPTNAGVYSVSITSALGGTTSSNVLTVVPVGMPLASGSLNVGQAVLGLDVTANQVYTAAGTNGLEIYDASNPRRLERFVHGETAGAAQTVKVVGDYAFLPLGGQGLEILHQVSFDELESVALVEMPGFAHDVEVAGGLAYVADGPAGLQLVSISDPASPVIVGSYDTPGVARGVHLANGLVFVADGPAGLQIVSATNPANVQLVGAYITIGEAHRVTVANDLAYVADGDGGLLILNVANPANPTLVGSYDTPGPVLDVKVFAGLALLAKSTNGLELVNVTDPANPILQAANATLGDARELRLYGTRVTVAAGEAGVRLVELAGLEPTEPQILVPPASYILLPTQHVAFSIVATGAPPLKYQWFKDGRVLFDTDRVSGSSTPELLITNLDLADSGEYSVMVRNEWNLAASASASLRVVPVGTPIFESAYQNAGDVLHAHVVGQTAYLADRVNGLEIVDFRNLAEPVRVDGHATAGLAQRVQVRDGLAYVAVWDAGLEIFDVVDPTNVVWVGRCDTPGLARGVRVVGDRAYVADSHAGLQVVDIRNPAQPYLIGGAATLGLATDVRVAGSTAFVSASASGLEIFDVSNPLNIVRLSQRPTTGNAESVELKNGIAYVADHYGGICLFSVTNPAAPVLLGQMPSRGDAFSVYNVGNLTYVAEGISGVCVVDTEPADQLSLALVGIVGDSIHAVQASGRNAFLSDRESGFVISELLGLPPVPPAFNGFPSAITKVVGDDLVIGAVTEGTPPFTYTWFKNGQPLSASDRIRGVNQPHLQLLDLRLDDAGGYHVEVSSPYGSSTSAVATVSVANVGEVVAAPEIMQQPENQSAGAGDSVEFSVQVSGSAPMLMRWYFNGQPLSDGDHTFGTDTTDLVITDAQREHTGNYQFKAWNSAGLAASQPAMFSFIGPLQTQINAAPTGAVIQLPPGIYPEALVLDKAITLTGHWWDRPVIDPGGLTHAVRVAPGVAVTLRGLTVRGGVATSGQGGGIFNEGNLVLDQCLLTGNSAAVGGAVANLGSLKLISTILANNVSETGGGLWNGPGGTVTLEASTLTANQAARGAGLFNEGNLAATNCLVSSNVAGGVFAANGGNGGGLYSVAGSVHVVNCTISGNAALVSGVLPNGGRGGGLNVSGGTVDLLATTVAANTAKHRGGGGFIAAGGQLRARSSIIGLNSAPEDRDLRGTLVSLGYNLIEYTDGTTITGDPTGNVLWVNPKLGPLRDNGGPTLSHLPQADSPVIDAGVFTGFPFDQRGLARAFDILWHPNATDGTDIGPVEYLDRSPYLGISNRTATGFTLYWHREGVLQTASTPGGAWTDVTNLSPYQVSTLTNVADFFRLRSAPLPPVELVRSQQTANSFTLAWPGIGLLEHGPSPLGPWQSLGSVSPYAVTMTPGIAEFFRVRVIEH